MRLRKLAIGRGMPLKWAVRKVAASAVSLSVVAAATLYLIAPSSASVAMNVGQVGRVQPKTEVVFGKVSNLAGHPVTHAKVLVLKDTRVVAQFSTSARGLYRGVVRLATGRYDIEMIVPLGHQVVRGERSVLLQSGRAYRASGHLTTRGIFSFLPVSSY